MEMFILNQGQIKILEKQVSSIKLWKQNWNQNQRGNQGFEIRASGLERALQNH